MLVGQLNWVIHVSLADLEMTQTCRGPLNGSSGTGQCHLVYLPARFSRRFHLKMLILNWALTGQPFRISSSTEIRARALTSSYS